MNHLAVLALLITAAADATAQFVTATIVEDGKALEYQEGSRSTAQAPLIKDQVGFSAPKVSTNGKKLGWLAEYAGSNTSYAVPLRLVVMDQSRRLHTFSGSQAIFDWCFSASASAVIYRQAALHGPTAHVFEMHDVLSGKLLKRFVLPWQGPEGEPASTKVPSWAKCAADE